MLLREYYVQGARSWGQRSEHNRHSPYSHLHSGNISVMTNKTG